MNRAAAYTRVSTDDQTERYGLQVQEEAIKSYAERQRLNMVEFFTDEGISGQILDRPGIQDALTAAQNGKFEHLILYDSSRLGRSRAVSATLRESFEREQVRFHYAGLGVSFEPGSEAAILFEGMSETMSEAEVASFVRKSRSGRIRAAHNGGIQIGGNVPFGYERKRVGDRSNRKTILIVAPDEAAIVRQIFQRFNTGASKNDLARWLNDQGVEKHNGYPWTRHDLYRILKDELYRGVWHYGKTRKVGGKFGKAVKVPRDDWIPVEVPAIVDEESWSWAQVRQKGTAQAFQRRVTHSYLLRGRIKCVECGEIYNAHTQSYRNRKGGFVRYYPYYMHNFRTQKSCENHTHLKVEWIEAQVKDRLWEWRNSPEIQWGDVLEGIEETHRIVQEQMDRVRKKRAKLKDEIERAKIAYTKGQFDLDDMAAQLERIEEKDKAYEIEERRLKTEMNIDPHVIEGILAGEREDRQLAEEEGTDFYTWDEWLDYITTFDVEIEVTAEGNVSMLCDLFDSPYPLRVASPRLRT